MAQKSTLLAKATEITLTALIEALQLLSVNVISPAAELDAEEKVSETNNHGGDDDPSSSKIVTPSASGKNPWEPRRPPVSIPLSDIAVGGRSPTGVASAGVATAGVAVSAPLPVASITPTASSDGNAVASGSSLSAAQLRAIEDSGTTGFVCISCKTHNVLHTSRDNYYAVTAGHAVGVYKGWHNVQPLVSGVAHACFKKYSSEAAALEAFEDAMAAGTIMIL